MKNQPKIHDLSSALEEVVNYKVGRSSALQSMQYDEPIDVKEIREKCNMTQQEFSQSFGVSLNTLQNWEQGRRKPDGPAKVLLKLIMNKPSLVKEALAEFMRNRNHVHG